MVLRRSLFSLTAVGATLVAFICSPSPSASFTVAPSLLALTPTRTISASGKIPPPPCRLNIRPDGGYGPSTANDNSSRSPPPTSSSSLQMMNSRNDDTYGFREGRIILLLVAVLNIWQFSIPPEFRRARFCSEENVRQYPESKCTTFAAWRKDVAAYYAGGGGVNFDFSVEGKE